MSNIVLLNNIDHQNLRVNTQRNAEFGDNVSSVITFPTEFVDIQRHYPILLRKAPENGEYQATALLGLTKDENLFLNDTGWDSEYIPAILSRGPFMIGFQKQNQNGELQKKPVIHVDLDNPRVNEAEGQRLFREHGGNTLYLESIAKILEGIHEGMNVSGPMYAAWESAGVIEPVNIDAKVDDDLTYNISSYYTVSEEKLRNLDGGTLEKLNRSGFLQGAYLMIASLNSLESLIMRKRRTLMRE